MDRFDAGMSPEVAVYRSDAIVVGKIVQIDKPRWTTPDGKAPKDVVYGDTPPEPQIVYRVATVRVTETLQGDVPATIRVSLVGAGDVSNPDDSQGAGWRSGTEVVLYLIESAAESRIQGAGWGLAQGLVVEGAVVRARGLSKRINAPLAIIDKRREDANVAEIMNIIGDVRGRKCIMLDDLIDTAGTLVKGAMRCSPPARKAFRLVRLMRCFRAPPLNELKRLA